MSAAAHKNGRPGATAATGPTHTVSVRFTDEELAAVERHMLRTGLSRGVLIREAMAFAGMFGASLRADVVRRLVER